MTFSKRRKSPKFFFLEKTKQLIMILLDICLLNRARLVGCFLSEGGASARRLSLSAQTQSGEI